MDMKFIVRRYFSGYCTYEINAPTRDAACEKARNMPIDEDEILLTLEDWKDCDEIEPDCNR
jgi:hypothetical protein